MIEAKPISSLQNVELLDRGSIVQITGQAFVAGTLPVKVDKATAFLFYFCLTDVFFMIITGFKVFCV